MGRVCAVPGCNSGSAAATRQTEADQVRKCSTFGVPKNSALRQSWADELGMVELKSTDRICELHFMAEDINLSDDFTIINGEIIVTVRERVTLRTNARPVRDVIESYQARQAQELEYCAGKKRKYWALLPEETRNKLKPIDDGVHHTQHMDDIILQDTPIAKVELSSDSEKNEDVPMVVDKNIRMNQLNITPLSLQNLIDILKASPLKENWAWAKKENGLFFTLVDADVLAIRCYLQVHSNMAVTLFFSDRGELVNFTNIRDIKSFENLTDILQSLENKKLCLGTGILQKSRSDTCSISVKAGERCPFCLKEKIKLENQRLSFENKSSSVIKTNRSLKYCKNKLDEARTKIVGLEQEIAALKVHYENKCLERLPEIQREIVTMFLKFADLDKNRIRYSRDWVCESFLMHTKSSVLYEYMRERGILPLPCPNTLKTKTGSIDNSSGFHDAIFDSPKLQASGSESREKRGKRLHFGTKFLIGSCGEDLAQKK